jgi:hypothetical protein
VIVASSTLAAGVAGLVLLAVLSAVTLATFRDRVPDGRLLLGVLALSIVYNLVDDHGPIWLLAIPPIIVVVRPSVVRAVAPRDLHAQADDPAAEPPGQRRPLGQYVAGWFILVVVGGAGGMARCHWGRLHEPLTRCLTYLPAVAAAVALVMVLVAVIEGRRPARPRNDRED